MAVPRQLPNAITIVRILCAPVFLWMLLADNGEGGALRWWAAVLFIVAIASDGVDGYIARRYDIVSDLGKLLDPIADKALTGAAFVGLSILGELDWWITIVVLVREIGITVYRFLVVSDHVLAAAWMGKLKTVAQAVALSVALVPFAGLSDAPGWQSGVWWVGVVTMTIAVVLTIASGVDYVISEVRGSAPQARSRVIDEMPDDLDQTVIRDPRETAALLLDRLVELGWTVAVAESLTGGLIVSTLVDVPGASRAVRGGVVAYATDVKNRVLGVDPALLEAHGAVHPRVARQMARGVRDVLGADGQAADVGIATTGVAGPDPQDGQPVGTVHIAVSTPLGTRVDSLVIQGDRERIRRETMHIALRRALAAL